MSPTRAAIGALFLAVLFLAGDAHAQIAKMVAGRGYFGVSAGAIIPDDVHSNISGADSASVDLSFDAGAAFTGFVGYRFTDQLTGEAELGYATADTDRVTGVINGVGVDAPVNGHFNSVLFFGNALWTPPLKLAGFSPYLGGGLGFASTDSSVSTVGGAAVGANNSETDFAAQFILGADYQVTDQFAIGGRYRFVWINSGSTTARGGDLVNQDDFTAHVLMVTGKLRF
jgi:opacity protein-like surface antigen